MREIKFRYVDKSKGIIPDDYYWIEDLYNQQVLTHSDYLLQYTGLKDKNGVEIYEDYIVKSGDSIFVIKWVNCGFVGLRNGKHDHDIVSHKLYTHAFEVIGNTYENPELLEK